MGVDMFLPEAKSQASSVQAICLEHINAMEDIKKTIKSFALEDGLKGKAYDNAKEYFKTIYIPLTNGII